MIRIERINTDLFCIYKNPQMSDKSALSVFLLKYI